MMIFIEIYIARRNQQGNGDKAEKQYQNSFVFL